MPLAGGAPSYDTFGCVLSALDAQQFEARIMRLVDPLCPALHDQVVAINGKMSRGSHYHGVRAIHLVSTYGCDLCVLDKQRTDDRSNEITAISALLDAFPLKSAIVTIYPMRCQT